MTKKIKDSKAKAPSKPVQKNTEALRQIAPVALFEHLLNKAGGQDAAMREFARDRVNGLSKGTTLRSLFDVADSEGWGAMLEAMTLGDLRGTVKAVGKTGTRKPRGSAEAMRKAVMAVLSGPAVGVVPARMIAEAIGEGTDPRAVGRALSELVKSGAVTRTGSKRDSKYTAV